MTLEKSTATIGAIIAITAKGFFAALGAIIAIRLTLGWAAQPLMGL